jgi:hypothetical protein
MVRSTLKPLVCLALLLATTSCERGLTDPCAVLQVEADGLLELQVGQPVDLAAMPAACAPAGVEWEVTRPAVAQVVRAGAHAATLGPVSPGSGTISVRAAGSGELLLAGVPYRVVTPVLPPLTRDTAALLQTDRLEYLLDATDDAWQVSIQATFVNRMTEPIRLLPCLGLRAAELQKRVGNEWVMAYIWIYPPLPCFEPGDWVDPGGSAEVTLHVRAVYPWLGAGFPYAFHTPGVAGTYRLLWWPSIFNTEGPGQFPEHQRVSNAFTLSVAARSE